MVSATCVPVLLVFWLSRPTACSPYCTVREAPPFNMHYGGQGLLGWSAIRQGCKLSTQDRPVSTLIQFRKLANSSHYILINSFCMHCYYGWHTNVGFLMTFHKQKLPLFKQIHIDVIPYSTKHWWEKTLVDLAVDSRSTKVFSANLLFHHGFIQALKVSINKKTLHVQCPNTLLTTLIYYVLNATL